MYTNLQLRQRIFALLTEQVRPGINLNVGRLGMNLWRVLILVVLKQGLGCDYDCLQELANRHQTVREMLGHSDGFYAERREFLPVANADRQCVAAQTAVANHPFLINAGYAETSMPIPWLGNRTLWFDFG